MSAPAVAAPIRRLADVERDAILAALTHFEWDKRKAAKALGVSLSTLYNRLHSYGLQAPSRVTWVAEEGA